MRITLFVPLAILVAGCAHVDSPHTDSPERAPPVIEETDIEARAALHCLGHLLDVFLPPDQPPLVISVGQFKNKSAPQATLGQDVPSDTSSMVEASLSQISSHVVYTDAPRLVSANQLPPWSITAAAKPDLFLEGGPDIQEKVSAIENESQDVGVSVGWQVDLRHSIKYQTSIAAIELDMNATIPAGKISVHGGSAPLRISFPRTNGVQTTWAFAAIFAIGDEKIRREVYSYSQALRLGIAREIMIILGRWRAVPYRSACLGQPEEDELVHDARIARWRSLVADKGEAAAGYLQELLAYNGSSFEVDRTDRLDEPTVLALTRFMASRGKKLDPATPLEDAYWELVLGLARAPQASIDGGRAWEIKWAQLAKEKANTRPAHHGAKKRASPPPSSAATPAKTTKPRPPSASAQAAETKQTPGT